MNTTMVIQYLRDVATGAHVINLRVELDTFSSHSIQVGLYVLLDMGNQKLDQIKKRLRWRSDTYSYYLRNTQKLAHQHSKSISSILKNMDI